MFRTGLGIDFHQLAEGRKLWIGGILIPHSKGSLGHSDADVLLHAVCDALLGAAGLGDIGVHFPDSDASYKDIDSKILLRKTTEMIWEKKFSVVNLDCTVCLQEPKIAPYVNQMQQTIAGILNTDPVQISIKATTTEKMGFIGQQEGIAALASVLLQQNS